MINSTPSKPTLFERSLQTAFGDRYVETMKEYLGSHRTLSKTISLGFMFGSFPLGAEMLGRTGGQILLGLSDHLLPPVDKLAAKHLDKSLHVVEKVSLRPAEFLFNIGVHSDRSYTEKGASFIAIGILLGLGCLFYLAALTPVVFTYTAIILTAYLIPLIPSILSFSIGYGLWNMIPEKQDKKIS